MDVLLHIEFYIYLAFVAYLVVAVNFFKKEMYRWGTVFFMLTSYYGILHYLEARSIMEESHNNLGLWWSIFNVSLSVFVLCLSNIITRDVRKSRKCS